MPRSSNSAQVHPQRQRAAASIQVVGRPVIFEPVSYGYQPSVETHQAVKYPSLDLQFGRYRYVVEADIKASSRPLTTICYSRYCASVSTANPARGLSTVSRRLSTLERDGTLVHPTQGHRGAGFVSPVLANIYLHFQLHRTG